MDRAQFTILSMMKDEGHSLIEWVAYHRVVGFDRICVYTNDCNDGTDAMLMRLEEMGHVHHFRNDVPKDRKPQPHALSLADANPLVTNSDWILVMDADEFLNVKIANGQVRDLVTALPRKTDAVAITWRFFGSSGITDWNPGLVTECYTHAAPDNFKKGWGVKTLFRPFEHMKFGIHRPNIQGARRDPARAQALLAQSWVNGSGKPMPDDFSLSGWRSTKPTLGYDLVEMNHYAVKSYEAYLLRRLRGNVNKKADKYNAAYFSIFDRNEIEVWGAQRHTQAVRALMAEMLSDPTLAALHRNAMEYHAGRVETLRVTGEYRTWLTELETASKLPIDRVDEVLFTQHLPKIWQERVKQMQAQGVSDAAIAKMIAESQTAKKGETRAALRAAAAGHPDGDADRETPGDQGAAPADPEPVPDTDKADPTPPVVAPEPPPTPVSAFAAGAGPAAARDTPAPNEAGTGLGMVGTAFGPKSGRVMDSVAKPVSDRVLPEMTKVVQGDATAGGVAQAPGIAKATQGPRIHLVATMKNEGPYIVEWIAHYRRLGVTDFTIFSNGCTDGTNLILNRLDALGIIAHFDNPLGPRMDPQRRAYSRAGKMERVRSADWVLVVDADEFLNIRVGDGKIPALIEACTAPDAISIPWRLMGSSGMARMSEAPVTQRFRKGSDFDAPENGMVWGFKTLFRPKAFDFFGVHRPKFQKSREELPRRRWTNASGEDTGTAFLRNGWRFGAETLGYTHAQINHYALKSREEFLLKRLRGTANSKDPDRIDMGYWHTFDLNTHSDNSINAGDRGDQLEAMMGALLKDQDLAVLHRAALDQVRRTITMQLEDPAVAAFVDTGRAPKPDGDKSS